MYLNTEGKKILPQSRASVRTNRRCNRSTDARSKLSTHYAKHGEFLGTALVDPTYATLQAYAPQLDVRLSNLSGRFNLEQEGVDAALVHGNPEEWQDYYCEKLSEDELVLVCSPDLIDHSNPVNLSDILKTYPLIEVTNERRKHDWQVWSDATGVARPKKQKSPSLLICRFKLYRQLRVVWVCW